MTTRNSPTSPAAPIDTNRCPRSPNPAERARPGASQVVGILCSAMCASCAVTLPRWYGPVRASGRRVMGTVAEDAVLVLHTHAGTAVFAELDDLTEILVGGCLLAEGLLAGVLRLDGGRRFSSGPQSITADVDPLVEGAARRALAVATDGNAEDDDGRWIAEVTFPIHAGAAVIGRLRARGAIRTEERKKFGRKATMVDVTDPAGLAAVVDPLRAVMLGGETPDSRAALTLLILSAMGANLDLDRAERKQWDARAEALFTWTYWQGDEGTPAEHTPGIDDETRRMLGDFVVSLGSAYQMGVASEILAALNRYHR